MHVARLNADGSIDSSFDPGSGPDGPVESLAIQSTGDLIIGGAFTSVNGVPRNRIARLHGGPFLRHDLLAPKLAGDRFYFSFQTISGKVYRVESTGSLSAPNWIEEETFSGDGSVRTIERSLFRSGGRFYRVGAE
jgi:hypothetical protein